MDDLQAIRRLNSGEIGGLEGLLDCASSAEEQVVYFRF